MLPLAASQAIGILAAAIVALEAHPHTPSLTRIGTVFPLLRCAASYGPAFPPSLKHLVAAAQTNDSALLELAQTLPKIDPLYSAAVSTTQAVDIVRGGVKINALPEQAEAVVNHRIAEDGSVQGLKERVSEVLLPVARRFDLSLDAFGVNVSMGVAGAGGDDEWTGKGGHLALSDAWDTAIEPAPQAPLEGPWGVLAGTIRAALAQSSGYEDAHVVVAPSLAVGTCSSL